MEKRVHHGLGQLGKIHRSSASCVLHPAQWEIVVPRQAIDRLVRIVAREELYTPVGEARCREPMAGSRSYAINSVEAHGPLLPFPDMCHFVAIAKGPAVLGAKSLYRFLEAAAKTTWREIHDYLFPLPAADPAQWYSSHHDGAGYPAQLLARPYCRPLHAGRDLSLGGRGWPESADDGSGHCIQREKRLSPR